MLKDLEINWGERYKIEKQIDVVKKGKKTIEYETPHEMIADVSKSTKEITIDVSNSVTLEEIPEYESEYGSEYESDKIRHRPNYEDENVCTITDLAENSEGIYASGMQKFDKYIREAAKNSPRGFSTRLALKVRDRYDALIQE